MAYIPSRAKKILNPVSAAPGFKIHNVWVMPDTFNYASHVFEICRTQT